MAPSRRPTATCRALAPLEDAAATLAMAAMSPMTQKAMSKPCCQRGSRPHPLTAPSGGSGPAVTSPHRAGEQVGGHVDVVAEQRFPHDAQRQVEAAGLGAVALEGTGAVGEGEATAGGNTGHVGA